MRLRGRGYRTARLPRAADSIGSRRLAMTVRRGVGTEVPTQRADGLRAFGRCRSRMGGCGVRSEPPQDTVTAARRPPLLTLR